MSELIIIIIIIILAPGKSPNPRRWFRYTTRVFAGTFRLLGFSREHARLTGPYARRLQRRSGHRGSVARDTWSSLNALPCPSDTDARRQRSWDEPNVTRDVKAIWEGASSEMDKARLRIAAIDCMRYQSPLAVYAYPTKPSESPSVCAWD